MKFKASQPALAILMLLGITLTFFWKVIFQDQIIFPGDMLVGAYYPWLDFKWGTSTGVAIKNPYITDIFSQIYLWKELIMQSYKNGQWPLWNPYSYSGYPLLANFQSGALNIFNAIFILFGMINGWNIFLILGILLSVFSMYYFLRSLNITQWSSVIASLSFGFSGFSILWMPYANANFALASIPFALFLINKYFQTDNKIFLILISPVTFFMVTAGHFQISIYGLILIFAYTLNKAIISKSGLTKLLIVLFLPTTLGILMSSAQLIPTFELSSLSIRFSEGFIKNNDFGLSPLIKLITLYIPDYFGNPSTFNYWGSFNYLETNFYVGILGILSLLWSILNFSKLNKFKFFIFCSLISLLLGFDTFLGKSVYLLNIPGISTSAAGRIASIYSLSTAILIGNFLDNITKYKLKVTLLPSFILAAVNIIFVLVSVKLLSFEHLTIALRNNIFPFIILLFMSFFFIISRKFKYYKLLILIIVVADLFRFGWKTTPFVSKKFVFPNTSLTEFLTSDKDYFRIEREYSPILPPNTWIHYGLSSSSGYDPLSISSYVTEYNQILNKNSDKNPTVSRYSELFYFDPIALGNFNVKYLLMQKNYSIDKKTFTYNKYFDQKQWKISFETNSYALFKNQQFKPRVETLPSDTTTNISQYSPNSITINVDNQNLNTILILRDTFYPGWNATINNHPIKIKKHADIYREVIIPTGQSTVKFQYNPLSFQIGLIISIISTLIFIVLLFII